MITVAKGDGGPRWFKKDIAFYANRKIMRAGRDGRDVFEAVLCMNAQRGSRGSIPIADWDPHYIARFLGDLTVTEAGNGMQRAIDARLVEVDAESVHIVGWSEHWGSPTKTRAEIQRDYRERQKAALPNDGNGVTEKSRVTDREKKEEKERENDSRSAGSDPEKPRKTRKIAGALQPLESAWGPSDSAAAVAQSLGLDLAEEARRFRLNAAQRGHTFADADAAFELFMRRSNDKGKYKPPKPGAYTTTKRPDIPAGLDDDTSSEQRENRDDVQQASERRKP